MSGKSKPRSTKRAETKKVDSKKSTKQTSGRARKSEVEDDNSKDPFNAEFNQKAPAESYPSWIKSSATKCELTQKRGKSVDIDTQILAVIGYYFSVDEPTAKFQLTEWKEQNRVLGIGPVGSIKTATLPLNILEEAKAMEAHRRTDEIKYTGDRPGNGGYRHIAATEASKWDHRRPILLHVTNAREATGNDRVQLERSAEDMLGDLIIAEKKDAKGRVTQATVEAFQGKKHAYKPIDLVKGFIDRCKEGKRMSVVADLVNFKDTANSLALVKKLNLGWNWFFTHPVFAGVQQSTVVISDFQAISKHHSHPWCFWNFALSGVKIYLLADTEEILYLSTKNTAKKSGRAREKSIPPFQKLLKGEKNALEYVNGTHREDTVQLLRKITLDEFKLLETARIAVIADNSYSTRYMQEEKPVQVANYILVPTSFMHDVHTRGSDDTGVYAGLAGFGMPHDEATSYNFIRTYFEREMSHILREQMARPVDDEGSKSIFQPDDSDDEDEETEKGEEDKKRELKSIAVVIEKAINNSQISEGRKTRSSSRRTT